MTELEEQIKVVAEARRVKEELDKRRKESYAEWIKGHQLLLDYIDDQIDVVATAEVKLRELTIEAYKETGNKKPAEGVGIRELIKLEYDPKDALKWAMEHQIALSLDKSGFEKIAKTTPLEFVTTIPEIQATIATKL